MKRFCDLKVGDSLYEYYLGEIEEREIIEIKNKSNFFFKKGSSMEMSFYGFEEDFALVSVTEEGQAYISTSIDKLLLECEQC